MNKIFAIGDIHGCAQKLRELIMLIAANREKDTLIFIGDYIDRGNSNRDVVDYVLQLKKEFKNAVCLLGNHEQMLLNYLEGEDEETYLYNGGKSTLSDYGISPSDSPQERKKKIPEAHLLFLSIAFALSPDKGLYICPCRLNTRNFARQTNNR